MGEQEVAGRVSGHPDVRVPGPQRLGQDGRSRPRRARCPAAARSWGSNIGRRPVATRSSSATTGSPPASVERPRRSRRGRALDPHARAHRDAVGLERRQTEASRLLVLLGQDVGERLQRGDPRAEPRVDLRELDPDRARPDHRERSTAARPAPRSPRGSSSTDRPPIPGIGGTAASVPVARTTLVGLDHGAVRELHATLADQAGLLEEHPDAHPLERRRSFARTGCSITSRARCPHRREVDLDLGDPQAEPFGVPSERRDLRASGASPSWARSRSGCIRRRACPAPRSRRSAPTTARARTRPRIRCRRRRSRRRRRDPSAAPGP